MKTLIIAVIVSVATADVPTKATTSTIKERNNSESTYIKNFTGNIIKVSPLTTKYPELLNNTTETTEVFLSSRKNGTITRQGEISEILSNTNTSKLNLQYRTNQEFNEVKNDSGPQDENKELQISFVKKAPDMHRNILKNIFERILSYKHLHVEKLYDKNEKAKIIKAYLLLVLQNYKRKWVPNKIVTKLYALKNAGSQVRSSNKRPKRSIKEGAGFTHDSETCKQYNNNLIKLWSNLSKYIGTAEKSPPNKSVLHNIGIMIQAYLDHVSPIEINTEGTTEKLIVRKERNISSILSPIVHEIRTRMDINKISEVNALTSFILDQVKRFRIEHISDECNKMIENQIATLVNLAFKKYLLNLNCNDVAVAHTIENAKILNNIPLNSQQLYDTVLASVSKLDKPRSDRYNSAQKLIKRSIETSVNTTMPSNTKSINSTDVTTVNLPSPVTYNSYPSYKTNFNNITTNKSIDTSSNESLLEKSFTVQSRKDLQLNGKYCADLALDQLILTVKLILRLYLLNGDCPQEGSNKFYIISKLIEATPIAEPFNKDNLDYLSQYHVLLQLVDNMEAAEMSNLFSTPKTEILQNKNSLEDFLRDISNLAVSVSYKSNDNNNILDNTIDLKRQQLLNSLHKYQQLSYANSDRLLSLKNAGPVSLNAAYNKLPTNGNNKDYKIFTGFQGIYNGIPINQHFEAKDKSPIYDDLTNNTTNDIKPAPSVINPLQYNLVMNYSETFPSNVNGNLNLLDSFGTLPFLNDNTSNTDLNSFKNALLYLATNAGTFSKYFSKVNNRNLENQLNNSPSVSSNNFYNSVLLDLLTKYNNRAILNNKINTQSRLASKINAADVNNVLRKPSSQMEQKDVPFNFGVNSDVNKENDDRVKDREDAVTSNLILKNYNPNTLRNSNLHEGALNSFNNAIDFIKPNNLRSNLNLDVNNNSIQPNKFGEKIILGNSLNQNRFYPLRTLNVQKTLENFKPQRDLKLNSSNISIENSFLNIINSSYIGPRPIQPLTGVPLYKYAQSDVKSKQDNFKSLFINQHSNSTKRQILNTANEFQNYLNNIANTHILTSNNYLRTYDKKMEEAKISPITSIDSLPTISSDPDANGDVELTYIFHHPQIVVYQPQVLVKRRIPYVDYINNFNKIFNNQKKNQQQLHLYKIVRYLPHNNVQVLYQSDNLFPILRMENTTSTN